MQTAFIAEYAGSVFEFLFITYTTIKSMDGITFFKLVRAMRSAQKMYFLGRKQEDLVKSRVLEKQVDDEIKRVNELVKNFQNEVESQAKGGGASDGREVE